MKYAAFGIVGFIIGDILIDLVNRWLFGQSNPTGHVHNRELR
jgi:hypothetical protein